MDKQLLVNQLDSIVETLRKRGIDIVSYRITPEYFGFRPYPVLVGVVVPLLKEASSKERIRLLNKPIFEDLALSERNLISGLLGYNTVEEMNNFFDEREGVGRPVVEPYWPD